MGAMTDSAALQLLLVEDDPETVTQIRRTLGEHFGAVHLLQHRTVSDAEQVDLTHVDLVLSDMNLPDGTGLELISRLLAKRADLPIVMVTSQGILDHAIEAIRRGAYDYVVKAGDYLFAIPLIVEKNLALWRTKQDNLHLAQQLTRTLDQVRIKNHQLQEMVHELETMAATDPLTGLANRRAFSEALRRSFAECHRYGHDLACIMIDLDGFKQLNDTMGHQRGDELLQCAARVLEAYCRESDIAARFGGDEFVLLLPETDLDTARGVAERIAERYRTQIAKLCTGAAGEPRLTMSMGLTTLHLSRPLNPEQLIAHADRALYRAKQAGKTCLMVYKPSPSTAAVASSSALRRSGTG